uniref:Myristylated membrane protein n=1 Tax=viral metagenome TaxID=1070528 RepID=A0A6C0CZD6_9ZZZZ
MSDSKSVDEFLSFLYFYDPQKERSPKKAWFGSSYPDKSHSTNKEACNHSLSCGFYYTSKCPTMDDNILWKRNDSSLKNKDSLHYTIPLQTTSCWNCLGNPDATIECAALEPSLFLLPTSPLSLYEIRTTREKQEFIVVYLKKELKYSTEEWNHLHSLFGSVHQTRVFEKQFQYSPIQGQSGRVMSSRKSFMIYGMTMCDKQNKDTSSGYFNTKNGNLHKECKLFYNSSMTSEQDEIIQEVCKKNPSLKECKCYHRHDEKDYQTWEHAVPNSRDAQCWYQPCTDSSRYFIPSELRSTKNCPTINCQNILLTGDEAKVWNNTVQQSVHCIFPSEDGTQDSKNNTKPPSRPSSPTQNPNTLPLQSNNATLREVVNDLLFIAVGIIIAIVFIPFYSEFRKKKNQFKN